MDEGEEATQRRIKLLLQDGFYVPALYECEKLEKKTKNTRVLGWVYEFLMRIYHQMGRHPEAYEAAFNSQYHNGRVGIARRSFRFEFDDSHVVAALQFLAAHADRNHSKTNDNFIIAEKLYAQFPYQREKNLEDEVAVQALHRNYNFLHQVNIDVANFRVEQLLADEEKKTPKKRKTKKKPKKQIEADKERGDEVEEEDTSKRDEVEEEKDDGDEQPIDKGKGKQEISTFSVSFTVTSRIQEDNNFLGTTTTDSIVLEKFFVCATTFQTINFSKLQTLCASNQSLLRVENLIKNPTHNFSYLLVCEVATGLDVYFHEELKKMKQVSKGLWWNQIKHNFRLIFRDVVRGLLFLFKEGCTCGNIAFNMFVTPNGRGRILPSLDPSSTGIKDVNDLISRMKSVILYPFLGKASIEDAEFGLPVELIRFFSDVPPYVGKLPPSFLVDHSFFWTIEERVDFIGKFSKLLKIGAFRSAFEQHLMCNQIFENWSQCLKGAYFSIWKKGDPSIQAMAPSAGQISIKSYSLNSDIVRFYGAAYKHVNDREYKRQHHKDYEDEDVEKDLSNYFPNFYVDMFASICSVTITVPRMSRKLKKISSCSFRKEELLSLEKKPVRVFVNSATGKFGVAVLDLIAKGVMLGEHQPVILYISDSTENGVTLAVLRRNLLSTGYPLLRDVIIDKKVFRARKDVDFAIISQHCVLDHIAAPDCKVLVICISNDTADALKKSARSIPIKNITCLTRLEHNKALSSISKKVGVEEIDVKNVIIWGELSTTILVVDHAIVKTSPSEKSVREIVNDDAWLDGDLVETVKRSNSLETFMEDAELPKAACDHIHDWVFRTPEDTWTAMGVYSDGSMYGVPDGIFFSFPVTCSDGEWKIVKGLTGLVR